MTSRKNKAVFLDKDGTLIRDIPYNVDTEKIVIEEETIEAIRLLKSEGFLMIVVSNQSGLAKGFFTEDQLDNVWNYVARQLHKSLLTIDAFYYCPHDPAGAVERYAVECDCHKPLPGLLLNAARDL